MTTEAGTPDPVQLAMNAGLRISPATPEIRATPASPGVEPATNPNSGNLDVPPRSSSQTPPFDKLTAFVGTAEAARPANERWPQHAAGALAVRSQADTLSVVVPTLGRGEHELAHSRGGVADAFGRGARRSSAHMARSAASNFASAVSEGKKPAASPAENKPLPVPPSGPIPLRLIDRPADLEDYQSVKPDLRQDYEPEPLDLRQN